MNTSEIINTHLINLKARIPFESHGLRLDQAVSILFPEHSRSRIQNWIKLGQLKVNGKVLKTRDKVKGGELIIVEAPIPKEISYAPENISLDILYEDNSLLILNKPAGLVVHPAAGNFEGTLLNALINYSPELMTVPRAGIVHRLDKDTSGIMMVAKTLESHTYLVKQLQKRLISREYEAIVQGNITAGGTINEPIGRHPTQRIKMAVQINGKPAITHYRVLERFNDYSLLKVNLETGRTHQIRVHLSYKHYPIVGDKTYGGRLSVPKNCSETLITALKNFPRQALHAKKLTLTHPSSNEVCEWSAPLPNDMRQLLKLLRKEN